MADVKLLLTLLALLTGFTGGDVVRAAPASAAAMGISVTLAEVVVEARVAKAAHRPTSETPRHLVATALLAPRAVSAAPVQPDFAPLGMRIRE